MENILNISLFNRIDIVSFLVLWVYFNSTKHQLDWILMLETRRHHCVNWNALLCELEWIRHTLVHFSPVVFLLFWEMISIGVCYQMQDNTLETKFSESFHLLNFITTHISSLLHYKHAYYVRYRCIKQNPVGNVVSWAPLEVRKWKFVVLITYHISRL